MAMMKVITRYMNIYKLIWIIVAIILLIIDVYCFAHLQDVWQGPLSKMMRYNDLQNPADFQMSLEGVPKQEDQLHFGLWISLLLCGYYLFKLNFISIYLQGLYHKYNIGHVIAGFMYRHVWSSIFAGNQKILQNPSVYALISMVDPNKEKYPVVPLILYVITLFIVYWLYAAIPMAVCGFWNGIIFPSILAVVKKIDPERGENYINYHLVDRRDIRYGQNSNAGYDQRKNMPVQPKPLQTVRIATREDPFKGLVGVDEAINALKSELAIPLMYPEKAKKFGVKPVKGILLYGPPGCGKTSIARAAARYFNCTFYAIKAGDIMSKWVGETEQNIKNLFAEARAKAPSIIFIDEIDHIGRRRDGGDMNRPSDIVLQPLLAEMDGFVENDKVVVIGATNRPDALDEALLRPGRFDRLIEIPLPDAKGRRELFKLYLSGRPIDENIDYDKLVAMTDGCSPAHIEQICNQAGLAAMNREIRNKRNEKITMDDLSVAVHKVWRNVKGESLKS